jgi:hypothetical protein
MTTSPFSKTSPTWPTGVDCRYLKQQILFPFHLPFPFIPCLPSFIVWAIPHSPFTRWLII